nr:hypothetical protein [Streptomyces sp. HNM0574]
MALGSAAPAFAADTEGGPYKPQAFSLNGGLQEGLTKSLPQGIAHSAGAQPSIGSQIRPLTDTVTGTTDKVQGAGEKVLAPVEELTQNKALAPVSQAAEGVTGSTPLLGGLPVR